MEIKAKINDTKAYIQTYKLLHSKGNQKQNEKTTYVPGENIYKQVD